MHVTKDTMTFTKPELRAMLAHASTDLDRPHLAGVAVDLALGRAWATDGKRLALAQARVTPTVTAAAAACIVAREVLERAVKACASNGRIAIRRYAFTEATADSATVLSAGDDYVAVEVLDEHDKALMTAHTRIDSGVKVPAIDQVIPGQDLKAKRAAWMTVDPRYLADLALVAVAAEALGVRCWASTGGLDPILHDVDGATAYWQIVIMPLRAEEPPKVGVASGAEPEPALPAPPVVAPANAAPSPKRSRARKVDPS